MSDLDWRADGIERAIAAGGVPLEAYRRPGFTGGRAVRRTDVAWAARMPPVPGLTREQRAASSPLRTLQTWLQGDPEGLTHWPMAWLGNRVSDLRYWLWRLGR